MPSEMDTRTSPLDEVLADPVSTYYLEFFERWSAHIEPQSRVCEISFAAQQIARVSDFHPHVRLRRLGQELLPEANLHLVLLLAIEDEVKHDPALRGFYNAVRVLSSQRRFLAIGPHVEDAFRRSNVFDPPRHFGEMITFLAAYICCLGRHPTFQSPDALRSLVRLYGRGTILFHLDGVTMHHLSLAE